MAAILSNIFPRHLIDFFKQRAREGGEKKEVKRLNPGKSKPHQRTVQIQRQRIYTRVFLHRSRLAQWN